MMTTTMTTMAMGSDDTSDISSQSSSDPGSLNDDRWTSQRFQSASGFDWLQDGRTTSDPSAAGGRFGRGGETWPYQRIKAEFLDSDSFGCRGSYSDSRQSRGSPDLSPDVEDRLRVRRERNKQAAARCRQRRVDLTNHLIAETESLEDEKAKLQSEISKLDRQRRQLEYVLQVHATRCSVSRAVPSSGYQPTDGVPPSSYDVRAHGCDYVTAPIPGRHGGGGGAGAPVNHHQFRLPAAHYQPPKSVDAGGQQQQQHAFDPFNLDDCLGGQTGLTPVSEVPMISGDVMMSFATNSDVTMSRSGGFMSPTTLLTQL